MVVDNQELFLNYETRTEKIWSILRATPSTYFVLVIVFFLLKPSKLSLYLLISYSILLVSSNIFKNISEKFYELTVGKNNPFWILGLGRRPDGATDCGSFLKFDKKPAGSYGMPSGHSMITWAIMTYLLLCLYEHTHLNTNDTIEILGEFTNNKEISKTYTNLVIIILIIFAIMVSYSRVTVENCHTVQQVIIGGIIGVVMGGIIYFVQRHILDIKTFY